MTTRIPRGLLLVAVFCAAVCSGPARAEEKAAERTPASPAGGRRGKALNFDGSVVEGMNKNPLNSAESTDKNDRQNKLHLYRKRQNFKVEHRSTAKEAGYSPGTSAGESK